MRELLAFQWRVLTFRATREELESLSLRHLVMGLLWTWAVGIGRWWDDPRAGGMQKLGVGSVAYVFVLSLVLWLVFLPLRPRTWSYRRVLTIVTLTAPPAILYAIPIERWMQVGPAAQLNLGFLAIVAIWRVALWASMAKRLSSLSGDDIAVGTALPLMTTMVALTFLNATRGVLEIMSGMRDPTADGLSAQWVAVLGQLSFLGGLPVLMMYLGRMGNPDPEPETISAGILTEPPKELAPSGSPFVVVDTTHSLYARLKPVPVQSIRLRDTFWEPRRRVNETLTLPSQYQLCEETGRIDNFRRAARKKGGPFQGRYYNDSDVYKWVEAASFALLAEEPNPELAGMLDTVVREIVDAQQPDGYLNTYFTFERQYQRWSNLKDLHELYCAGHLIQAAVAHRRCTGKPELLRAAVRYADLICEVFGPEGRLGTCGHQEIEMALVELYRETGERRYLEQAKRFIEVRGQQPPIIGGSPYHQDHAPFRKLDEVAGHAVRMMYYCAGAADIYTETGDPEYLAALERLWANMTQRRMYVTGGLGSRYEGEAFGADYELPNERAYAESCAAIGSVMWNWRMLQLRGEARYADLIEQTLYNAVLPGLSLDGQEYLYQNPLADDGSHRRKPWFDCACCPPNIARILTQLPGYFYSTSEEGIWVHLYAASSALVNHGAGWLITQETDYPWSGDIHLRLTAGDGASAEFTLFLRVPVWATGALLEVNGETVAAPVVAGEYIPLRRTWQADDCVHLMLPMPVRRIAAHPYVTNNVGRTALARGPLIYCAEQTDLGLEPRNIVLPAEGELAAEWEPNLLGGAMVIRGKARLRRPEPEWGTTLYREQAPPGTPAEGTIPFTAIPYYAWGNREAGSMAVWLAAESQAL